MPINPALLAPFGWGQDFTRQLDLDDFAAARAFRVAAVHRDRLDLIGPDGPEALVPPRAEHPADAPTVGDWLLLAGDAPRLLRLLERRGLFRRRAAGDEGRIQPIAANVDTALLVTAAGGDVSPARLERYLALAATAGAEPVIVVTRADLDPGAPALADSLRALAPGTEALALDARDPAAVTAALAPWTAPGRTLALLGSSGVGKTTLANALTGGDAATGGLRKGDGKGRHTTTARQMQRLSTGAWLIDTPGMREIGLAGAADGLARVFSEIEDLARDCRFRDCTHGGEPGCAVTAAVEQGRLDPRRLDNWQKLAAEDARTTRSAAERRAGAKRFGRIVKEAKAMKARDRE